MKRYLFIKHYLRDTYTTDKITQKDLIDAKEGTVELIVDFKNKTFFDPEKNCWIVIKEI